MTATNVNNPSGFKPVRHAFGGVVRSSRYYIASGLASNIFLQDPVIPVNTNKRINVAAAGNRLQGVFGGCSYVNAAGDTKFGYWPTGTTLKSGTVAEALVYDDPNILFEAQAVLVLAQTDIGNFADISMATAGNTYTQLSGAQIDQTTVGTGSGGQLKLIEFVDRPDNVIGSNYARALVLINETYAGPDTTAGNSLTAI